MAAANEGMQRHRQLSIVGSRWRDWANLDEGPLGLIAERVLANDVGAYIHFRAVCPAWRRCCAGPCARSGVLDDPRFYPRQWIMFRRPYEALHAAAAPHTCRRHFINTSTGQFIQVDIPELRDHRVLEATMAEGLLFLLPCKTTTEATTAVVVRLLNPLTRQMAQLPEITYDLQDCSSASLVNDSTVCLYFEGGGTLAIAKPGDDRWVLLNIGFETLRPTIYFAGHFYGVTSTAVMTVDMEAAGGPRMVVAAKLANQVRMMMGYVHLVDNAGDLTLVHSMVHRIPDQHGNLIDKRMHMVYHVDLKAGKMRLTRNLGGHAIFMDYRCALSVSPQVLPFLSTDTIYMGRSLSINGHRGPYHLTDGSIQPSNNVPHNGDFACPSSIVACLVAYVSL